LPVLPEPGLEKEVLHWIKKNGWPLSKLKRTYYSNKGYIAVITEELIRKDGNSLKSEMELIGEIISDNIT